MPRRLSNSKDRPNGASLRLRLAQSATIEEALEDLAEIAAEKEFIFTVSGSSAADWNANSNLRTMWPWSGKSMKSKPASKAGKLNLS